MSNSYNKGFRSVYKLNAHIVLVTKYRKKAINNEIKERLNLIFKQTLNKWDCEIVEFNAEEDHCHLMIDFKPNVELSKLIANMKTVSSRLLHRDYPYLKDRYFYGKNKFWTGSYFVVSCGGANIDTIKKYIQNQKEIID